MHGHYCIKFYFHENIFLNEWKQFFVTIIPILIISTPVLLIYISFFYIFTGIIINVFSCVIILNSLKKIPNISVWKLCVLNLISHTCRTVTKNDIQWVLCASLSLYKNTSLNFFFIFLYFVVFLDLYRENSSISHY